MMPDQRRRRLVQSATRGARMGAIGARQAITGSTLRRRARRRPRQPARPTSAVRRILPTQAAASFTWATTLGSTSTPTRSAPATPARCCCAPVRPVLARPAEAPRGVDDSSSLGHSRGTLGYTRATIGYSQATGGCSRATLGHSRATMGYSRATMGYSRATMGYSRGTMGYSRVLLGTHGLLWGTHGLLWGTHGLLWGHASIPHCSARRRSTRHTVGWMRMASLCGRERCCEGTQEVIRVLRRPQGVLIGY